MGVCRNRRSHPLEDAICRDRLDELLLWSTFTLMLQKPEGLRAKAPRVPLSSIYCKPLATPDLESSGFPAG